MAEIADNIQPKLTAYEKVKIWRKNNPEKRKFIWRKWIRRKPFHFIWLN